MQERLSFYLPRESALHALNPTTKLILALTLITLAFLWPGLLFPLAIYLLVLIPLSIWGQFAGAFLSTAGRLLLPLFSFLFVMQSLFYPGGQTVLFEFWIFSIKAEGITFAFLTASRILVMVSSFLILLFSTSPAALMSDLSNRGLPASLVYILTATLQILPQMRAKANTVIDAQRARGLSTKGNLLSRARALLPLVAPLVFGSLVEVEERAIAIEARAFSAGRRRTSLNVVQDTKTQKTARWLMGGLLLSVLAWRLWVSFQ